MQSFHLINPSPMLASHVKHYWFLNANSRAQASERVIPNGQICLMFHRGERLFSSAQNAVQPNAFIGGLSTSYTDLKYSGKIDLVCVVFQPIGAKAFFKMPLIELREQHVNFENLSDNQLIEFKNRLFDAIDIPSSVYIIEQFLIKRFNELKMYNLQRINSALHAIHAGQQNIANLAQTACLSYKQFKRIFADYVGANPKDYLRIVRFQKALYIMQLQPSVSLAQLACECGFYDQSHLINEFKTLSGYTPTEYLNVCVPYSDYFS